MKLYFSPLACSLATRIALYEAGAPVKFVEVDGKTKKTDEGSNFLDVHPLGLVPALELDDGLVVAENAAVLQLVAGLFPEARLAPSDPEGRARLQQWLCFIGTELHKGLYVPLLDKTAPPEAQEYALRKRDSRIGWVEKGLAGREYLLGEFSVADAYLFAILNWSMVSPVDLAPYPSIVAFQERMRRRPSVARAFSEELALYLKSEEGAQAAALVSDDRRSRS